MTELIRLLDMTALADTELDCLPRPPKSSYDAITEQVSAILHTVQAQGDAAVSTYSAQFDGWKANEHNTLPLRVPNEQVAHAVATMGEELEGAITKAIEQVSYFHTKAKPADWETVHDGTRMGVRHTAVKRAGIYVPGGRAAYPSTVLMTVIPALVAGVEEIVICTPPGPAGEPNPSILAACSLAGATKIFRIGGAQAIAAMAYGTESVPACDVIVGPGNAFVNEAKLQVQAQGKVRIDTPAGVSEVLLVADEHADPTCVATSLIAQAEHDPMVTSILVTPSRTLADAIPGLIAKELETLATAERITQALAGQGAIVLVRDLEQAVKVSDAFAPEHLEVQTVNAPELALAFNHAGTIFIGVQTPTAFGDYCAGPNHTLPTGGTARFSGGLTTSVFMKPVNFVEFTKASSADLAHVVKVIGTAEGLPAHIRSVEARNNIYK